MLAFEGTGFAQYTCSPWTPGCRLKTWVEVVKLPNVHV